jgi:glycolate oxidase
MKVLAKHGAYVAARGSGTGLAGGCVGFENGVVVSTARLNKILAIDLPNRVAHVQAGVRNTALSDAVATLPGGSHYHFAPDPSSQRASTIGGNASTNAGGVHTLKDFVTSNHILGMEFVRADGETLRLGAAGGCYESGPIDLPALVCGSEGTLGIITSLWVRLSPKATSHRTCVAIFDTQSDACKAVSDVIGSGILPAAMEMLDGRMVQVVSDTFQLGFPASAEALLLTELDGIDELLDDQMERVLAIFRENHVAELETSADAERRLKLWKARKGAFPAAGRLAPANCTQDACVPRSKLAEVLKTVAEIGAEFGLQINNVFHAGDGNIHPLFLYDDADDAQTQAMLRASERVLRYCVDIGGTITGEHGVGVEKIHMMPYQFDAATLAQFSRLKAAFDPEERINAGKHIPSARVNIELLKPVPDQGRGI